MIEVTQHRPQNLVQSIQNIDECTLISPWLLANSAEVMLLHYACSALGQALTVIHLSALPEPFLAKEYNHPPLSYSLTTPKHDLNNLHTHPLSHMMS